MDYSNKLKVTHYEVLDKLPNPFRFFDGSRVETREDWEKRRKELIETAVELQYGSVLPEPEFLEVEQLSDHGPGALSNYRIITGTRAQPVSFIMMAHRPNAQGKLPAVIDGDMCWNTVQNPEITGMFHTRGILFVKFNRLEIAPDMRGLPRNSALHKAYPDGNFTTTMAWAWGYSRCVDALIKLGIVDEKHIAFTGLSRGGKAALLAGAIDERAWLVNPEAPCAGGSCYRLKMKAITQDNEEVRSEELEDIVTAFPDWFTDEMQAYKGRVPELPFDEHELKALVAPRILFDSEAKSDIWASPLGSYQTDIAAREVYRFLGAEENILWYWREGYHSQTAEDFGMLLNLMEHKLKGEKLSERFFKLPFDTPEPMFDWSAENR